MAEQVIIHDKKQARRAGIASFVGTSVEWYDFFIYGTAAALVFGKLFFPDADPAAGTLLSFATFGVGYLARPIGGIVFGHLGDRIGRKKTLIITLIMMGIATVAVGLLPTYAQIGIAAPILLVICRLIQGFAVGGEWGGAVLIASEHSQKRNKVSAGAWAQQGAPTGNILASLVFLIVSTLPDEQFESWGWRIPFLVSAVLIIIGLIIRSQVNEPREFLEAIKAQKKKRVPIAEVLTTAPKILIAGIVVGASSAAFGTFFKVLGLDYAVNEQGVDRQAFLLALTLYSVWQFIFQPFAALAASKAEPIKVIVWSGIVAIPLLPVAWLAMGSGSTAIITLGMMVSVSAICWQYGLVGGFLADAFPTHVRYTAISLCYQMTNVVFVSIVPIVGAALLLSTGSVWSVIGMQIFYALISLAAVLLLWRWTGAGSVEKKATVGQDDSELPGHGFTPPTSRETAGSPTTN